MLNYKLAPKLYLKDESSFDHDYIDNLDHEQALILAKDMYFLFNSHLTFAK